MLETDLSPAFRKIVKKVVDNLTYKSEILNVTTLFTSPSQPELNVFLSKNIKSLVITQNYLTNYTDKIILHLQVTEEQYVVLYNSRQDLQCKLEFSTFDPMLPSVIPEMAYFSKVYKAIMLTNADIYKIIPASKLRPDDTEEKDKQRKYYDVDIELVSNTVFEMRKKRFNFILTNVTMDSVLKYTTNMLGISKASIVPPDNNNVYINFLVPPNKDIASVMKYYQEAPAYGVYNAGFCFYVTDDTMFIFPRFGRPQMHNPINIYCVGEKNYEGLSAFGYKDFSSESYHILCNTEVREKNFSDLGSENEITAINTQLNETLIEGMKFNKQDEVYLVIPNIANHFVKPSDPVSKNTFNMDFSPTHSNSFCLKSKLLRYQAIGMTLTWQNARPFTFTPSTLVRYHYDDRFGYATKDCTCETVIYTITPTEGGNLYPGFSCEASVALNSMTV